MITVVSWNINKQLDTWDQLLGMDADVALLQEVGSVPPDAIPHIGVPNWDPWEPWENKWYDRYPMVVRLSDRVRIEWFRPVLPQRQGWEDKNEIAVSDIGTVAFARVIPLDGQEPFIAVSMYARWLRAQPSASERQRYIYSDRSAHRIISDLAAFIDSPNPASHRILAAGDLNMIYGASEKSRLEIPARARTITDRMDALGIEFLGPQHPSGRRASPPSPDVPLDTKNVPTYHTVRQNPKTARNQLDYVFASRGFHESIRVRALNSFEEWATSDHCRLLVEIDAT